MLANVNIILGLRQLSNAHHFAQFAAQNRSVCYFFNFTMVVPSSNSPRQTAIPLKRFVKSFHRDRFANCSASNSSPISRSLSATSIVWFPRIIAQFIYDIIPQLQLLVQKTQNVFHLLHSSRTLSCKT